MILHVKDSLSALSSLISGGLYPPLNCIVYFRRIVSEDLRQFIYFSLFLYFSPFLSFFFPNPYIFFPNLYIFFPNLCVFFIFLPKSLHFNKNPCTSHFFVLPLHPKSVSVSFRRSPDSAPTVARRQNESRPAVNSL